MSYTISIDNKTFVSKEEAFKHFEENYLFEQKDKFIDKIVSEIQSVITSDLQTEVKIDNEQTFSIVVKNNECSIDAVLNCKEGVHCYGGVYSTLESVVEFFRWSTYTVSMILNTVKNTYDFKEFKFDRYHNDYGNGHYFNFSYVTHEDTQHYITYEPGDINDFVGKLKQHFVSSLEGEAESLEDEGYFIDYSIGGIPISGLLERAKTLNKKVRLEILE